MDAPFLIPNVAFEKGAVASIHAGHDYSMVVTEAGACFHVEMANVAY